MFESGQARFDRGFNHVIACLLNVGLAVNLIIVYALF